MNYFVTAAQQLTYIIVALCVNRIFSGSIVPTRWTRAIYYFEIVIRNGQMEVAFAFRVVQYQYAVFNEMYFIRKLYRNIEFVRFMRVFFFFCELNLGRDCITYNTECLVATVRRRTV